MSLMTRLVAPLPGEDKLPVHQFMAALAELYRGAPGVTQGSIATAFNLTAGEQTQLANFVSQQSGGAINREMIHDVLMLGELGIYSVQNCLNRLGV
jgi:hypothetical protein